jgi:hypothetical protein
MKSIKQRLEEDYLAGCIKYGDEYHFYLMPLAWWILNYEKYSPSILNDVKRQSFRNGVLNVSQQRINDYFDSISDDKITPKEIIDNFKNVSEEFAQIYFFIDFDEKLYITSFVEIEVETYLPDEYWKGMVAEPLNHIPEAILPASGKK